MTLLTMAMTKLRLPLLCFLFHVTHVLTQCISDLEEIHVAELESGISPEDIAQPRVYKLCPHTTFTVGSLGNGEYNSRSTPLSVRSNAIVQCGDDGKRENGCIITSGVEIQYREEVDSDYGTALENVVFQGLTFSESVVNTVKIVGFDGNILFQDCLFQVRVDRVK